MQQIACCLIQNMIQYEIEKRIACCPCLVTQKRSQCYGTGPFCFVRQKIACGRVASALNICDTLICKAYKRKEKIMRRVKKELSLVDSYRFNKCCYKDVEARINEWMKDYIVANPYSSSCDPVKKRQQWQLTLENKKRNKVPRDVVQSSAFWAIQSMSCLVPQRKSVQRLAFWRITMRHH